MIEMAVIIQHSTTQEPINRPKNKSQNPGFCG